MKKLIVVLLLSLCLTAQGWERKPILGNQINWAHPLAKGLVGYWLMNEGSGSKVYDLSGNGNVGTFVNNTSWVSGKFGSALGFDGAGDSVQTAKKISLTDFTYTAWINHHSSLEGDDSLIVGIPLTTVPTQCAIFLSDDNGLEGHLQYYYPKITGGIDLRGDWHFVAVTRKGEVVTLYTDGKEVGSGVDSKGAISDLCIIGSEGDGTEAFNGEIDNITICNRAYSASEVSQLYREPFCMLKRTPIWMFRMVPAVGGGQVIIINMQ